jgi:hypothetical protein
VLAKKEQPFFADLSFQLSEIYQRPASSIMVILAPETPMLLGENVESDYHITITALSLEVAPTKNKRNTTLLQAYMFENLQIPLDRGVIRLEAIAEANLATQWRHSASGDRGNGRVPQRGQRRTTHGQPELE